MVEGGVVLAAAEQEHPLALRCEGPQRTSGVADLPTGLVHVDDGGVSHQSAQDVELVLPVLSQLPQQGVGLRLGQRQLTEEAQHGAGLVEGNADDVHEEGQHDQDFNAILAARRDAGDAWLLAAGLGEDTVADAHGPAVFQAPHRSFADQCTVVVADAVGINVFGPSGVGELQLGWPTAWRFLATTLAAASAFHFGLHAVGRRWRFRRRLRAHPALALSGSYWASL